MFCRTVMKGFEMKRTGFYRSILFFIFMFVSLTHSAFAFNVPEKLIFDLTWAGIKAGTATLNIIKEQDSMKIVSTARSDDWVSLFYTVDDRIESRIVRTQSSYFALPQNYLVKIREGRHRRHKEVIFDHEKRKAVYINHIENDKKTLDIGENTLDPLSSFYHIRTMNIEVGKSVFLDIFDSKRLWNIEVQILRKEKIQTSLGEFNTIVIKPLMKSEGIFNRKGDMYIWLTDDMKHIPVKMQTKVAVGSITATLVGGNY
ncbi:MAG: DUF3108 domain-containing protein [Nitrospirota bacterium]